MKRGIIAAALAAWVLAPAGALAGERAGDAVLGAVSGAVVLGPVGAAAGAVIGYTAGPAIARSWGIGGRKRYRNVRRARPARAATGKNASTGTRKRGDWYNVTR